MSEIEGSSSSESSDDSVRCLGETNPLVEGEVLTPGEPDNPISVDDDDLYKQNEIDEAHRWMQENTAQIEATEACQGSARTRQAEQRAETIRAASPTLTLFGTAVQQTASGSTEKAESARGSARTKRKTAESDSEDGSEDPRYQKLQAQLKRKDELLKRARKSARESQEELLKLFRARNESLERDNAALRAQRTASSPATSSELHARTPAPEPTVTVLVTEAPQQTQPKKKGRPTRAEREAKKEQEEKEKAEEERKAAAAQGRDLQPLGSPKGTGKMQELKDKADKNYKLHGTGSFGGWGSQVTTSQEARPSTTSQNIRKGTKFVGEEDREKARTLSEGFLKQLQGREKKKLIGRISEPTSVCL